MGKKEISVTINVGGVVAMLLSWYFNCSVLWALFHFILGWQYVAYRALMFIGLPQELSFIILLICSIKLYPPKIEYYEKA